ncbi:MAG: right-handed parallel beta-helix repeat-containing protein [Thermoplasmata archaeon]|nr:right-handed parallel beta-helix repeat-containing protein [Thermoplasmata archaeon]
MKKAIIVLISVLMFTSMMIVPASMDYVEASVPVTTTSGLVPHAPIRIDSNADFTLANGVNNTGTGNGTVWNPWIIENWEVDGNGLGDCIYVGNTTDYFQINNCSLLNASGVFSPPYNQSCGVNFYNVMNGRLFNNTIYSSEYDGIYFEESSNNSIINNTVQSSALRGVFILSSSENNIIDGNNITESNYGIILNSSNNLLFNNTITNNNFDGIRIYSQSLNNTLLGNNISSNVDNGIYLESTSGNLIEDNTLLLNKYGIKAYQSNKNAISKCNISLNYVYGIWLRDSEDNTIEENDIVNCTFSDYFNGTYMPVCIFFELGSHNNVVKNNFLSDDMWALSVMQSNHAKFENNIIDGRGISIFLAENSTISNNTFNSNNQAIQLSHSNNNVIINNTASASGLNGYGIHLSTSHNNKVLENKVSNSTFGIIFHSSLNNRVENNTALSNDCGIYVYSSNNTRIVNNNIQDNAYEGASIKTSSYCTIYNNTFENNPTHALDDTGNNAWDNGYPDGGNYWSDYAGLDDFTGPDQDIPGSDGLGDTNYTITGGAGAMDNYPLMNLPGTPDAESPYSIVNQPYYWHSAPTEINATSNDNITGTANVTFHYRFSTDNTTFGNWTELGLDDALPWNWLFSFPDGEGYYQFYSIAVDAFNNTELAPVAPTEYDAECAYDITAPESEILTPTSFWHDNRTVYLDWTANDTAGVVASGFGPLTNDTFPSHDNVDLWMRFSADNQAWGAWSLAVENMWNGSIFNTSVLEDGWFQFYSIASDLANNTEPAPASPGYDAYIGVDTVAPVAVAGSNQTISQGNQLTFNASGSTDNLGIANYTWSFTYQAQSVVVSTQGFNFTFHHYGQYLLTLTVTDHGGNTHSDTLLVVVQDTESPIADAGKDQQTDPNVWITFDGSGSTDNVGIINYTWTFVYNGSQVNLYGPYPKFRFTQHDTYNVTLTVRDEAGNSDTDTVEIYVKESISPGGSFNWVVVIFVLVLIIAVAVIMALYFKKDSSPRDPDGRYTRDDEDYESDPDGRYDRDRDDRY